VVELPGVDNPVRVRKLLQASAVLEFWETYDNLSFYQYMGAANSSLKDHLSIIDTSKKISADSSAGLATATPSSSSNPLLNASEDTSNADLTALNDTGLLKADSGAIANKTAEDQAKENPLYTVLFPNIYTDPKDNQQKYAPGPIVGLSLGRDTAKANDYLRRDYVRANFPKDVKFLWSAKPTDEKSNVFALYAIKMPVGSERAPLEGDKVISARQDIDQNGSPEVAMSMNNEGAKIWKVMTSKNVNKFIAIVLDNYVYSAPRVNGEIPNGRSSISGGFEIDEAKDLANILQAGKLDAPATIIAEDVVGPSLGKESIAAGIRSIVIAFVALLFFMIFYYNTSGIIANILFSSTSFSSLVSSHLLGPRLHWQELPVSSLRWVWPSTQTYLSMNE
jgi:SecD/SecF fusion protein